MSLIVTGVQKTRTAARRTACASNLRQIALACHLYADDHRGQLPYAATQTSDRDAYLTNGDWLQDLLIPYAGGEIGDISRIFRCPGVREGWLMEDPGASHYRYNAAHAAGTYRSEVRHPGDAVLLFDAAWADWSPNQLPHDGVNLVFLDQHVAFAEASSFLTNMAEDLDSDLMSAGWAP